MSDEEFRLPKGTIFNHTDIVKRESQILEWREKARRFDEEYKTYYYKNKDDNGVLQIAVDIVEKAEKYDKWRESISRGMRLK